MNEKMNNVNPFGWKDCNDCQETSRRERNLNCTFVRVNFKESYVKMSHRMTEIPFSYCRDKAFLYFEKRRCKFALTRQRTKKSRRLKKPPTAYYEPSLSFIFTTKRYRVLILNFSTLIIASERNRDNKYMKS